MQIKLNGKLLEVKASGHVCPKCRERPVECIIFEMCWPCFEDFEKKISAHNEATGEKYSLSDKEFELVNEPFADRSKA